MIEESPNNRIVYLRIEESPQRTRRAIRRGFDVLGRELVKRNRELIRKGPKTGKFYRIKGRKRRHRASAPGEPPANLTGALARSIGFQIETSGDEMAFGSRSPEDPRGGVEYGAWLDGGTRRIKPRPHVSRTVKTFDDRAETIMNEEIMKVL